MAIFAVNTGCRDQEISQLRWGWEVKSPILNTSFFLIPDEYVKNGEERLVVLNDAAKSVIDEVRGEDKEFVFTRKGKPVRQMNQRAWKSARLRVVLPHVEKFW